MKEYETVKGQATPNHRRRKDKESEITLIQLYTIKLSNNKKN
jgi:hypothetical protein